MRQVILFRYPMPPTVGLCVSRLYALCKNNNNKAKPKKQTNIKTATFIKRLDIKCMYLDLKKQSYRTPNFNLWILLRNSYASPSKNLLFT